MSLSMRIVMIGQKGMPATFGGVERHVHDLSVRLASMGHQVTVYSRSWYSGYSGVYDVCGVRVAHAPSVHTKHLDTITHAWCATLHAVWVGADVFHFHGVGPALLAWIPRMLRPRSAVITTFHSVDRKHKKWGRIARAVLFLGEWSACAWSHRVIAVCITIRKYVDDVFGVRAVYIPNGVEMEERSEDTDALLQFGAVPARYVLCVSRFVAHKRLHDVVRGWQMLRALESASGATQLVIVGDGFHTDAYSASLRGTATGDTSIIFTGFQSGATLRQLYSHALCFVHASEQEGLPISVIEAMSYGLPVVLSNIPEHTDLVQDYRFLFGEQDVVGLAKTLAWTLSLPEEKRAMFGEENKQKVLREFTWDELMPQIVSVYAQFIKK
jgi:glycosyltransferase involved in cell wall biosynthesis